MTSPVGARLAKRAMDVAGSVIGLAAGAPVFACVALAVRLDGPGPIFFRQWRVGRHGELFRIHKFRTMIVRHAGEGAAITAATDPRITRVGRWLRRSKLDELPQLWDVLRGKMSLVGPRPEVPQYVALYPPDDARVVLSVRPGMTDPVSLLLRDEQSLLASAPSPEWYYETVLLPAKLLISRRYVQSRSLASDVRVIFLTLRALAGRPTVITAWGHAEDFAPPAPSPATAGPSPRQASP